MRETASEGHCRAATSLTLRSLWLLMAVDGGPVPLKNKDNTQMRLKLHLRQDPVNENMEKRNMPLTSICNRYTLGGKLWYAESCQQCVAVCYREIGKGGYCSLK